MKKENLETKLNEIKELLSSKPEERPLSSSEAAEYLNVAKSYLYKMCCWHKLVYYKPAKRIYFLKKDLNEYLLKNRVKSAKEIEKEAVNYCNSK